VIHRTPSLKNYSIESNNLMIDEYLFFKNSRDALCWLLINLQKLNYKTIAIPSYNCDTVISSIKVSNIDYITYDVNSKFCIDEDKIDIDNFDVFLFINYFGFHTTISNDFFVKLKNKNKFIICDNAHSFYKFIKDVKFYNYIDASFTSLVKSLPFPYGSFLYLNSYTKAEMKLTDIKNSFIKYKIISTISFILKKIVFLKKRLFSYTEQKDFDYQISPTQCKLYKVEEFVLKHINIDAIFYNNINIINLILKNNMELYIVFHIKEGDFPVCLPIYTNSKEDRDKLIYHLIDNYIDAYSWANMNKNYRTEQNISIWNKLVCLPIQKEFKI